MAFTKVVGPGIHTLSNITSHNIHSSGIITAVGLDVNGPVSIGGTLTYEDVTSIDSVGLITARNDIFLPDNSKIKLGNNSTTPDLEIFHSTTYSTIRDVGTGNLLIGGSEVHIRNSVLNENCAKFISNGAVELYHDNTKRINTTLTGAEVSGILTATSFSGDGSALSGITAGYWGQDSVGVTTNTSAGINTSTINDSDLVGVGNSFQGLYISNGMMIMDNKLSGNHYIGTAFNGLMAGPVTVEGTLTVEGNYVVV